MKIEMPSVSNVHSVVADPLGVMQGQRAQLESTSAVKNDRSGVCPKCGQQMTFASIHTGERAYYCVKCRVAAPLQN